MSVPVAKIRPLKDQIYSILLRIPLEAHSHRELVNEIEGRCMNDAELFVFLWFRMGLAREYVDALRALQESGLIYSGTDRRGTVRYAIVSAKVA